MKRTKVRITTGKETGKTTCFKIEGSAIILGDRTYPFHMRKLTSDMVCIGLNLGFRFIVEPAK